MCSRVCACIIWVSIRTFVCVYLYKYICVCICALVCVYLYICVYLCLLLAFSYSFCLTDLFLNLYSYVLRYWVLFVPPPCPTKFKNGRGHVPLSIQWCRRLYPPPYLEVAQQNSLCNTLEAIYYLRTSDFNDISHYHNCAIVIKINWNIILL